MAYAPAESMVGITPIGQVDLIARHPPGSIRRFADGVLGEGEFIYLPGVAGNFVGAGVSYDLGLGTVALLPAGSNPDRPIAVSMETNANPLAWSWYQIGGLAAISSTGTIVDGDLLYATSSNGVLSNVQANGNQVQSASWSGANGAAPGGLTYASIARPFMQGQTV